MGEKLREYARLAVEVGLKVYEGQTMLIRAPIAGAEFVRLCAEAAYDAGCREVITDYSDDALTRMRYLRAEDGVFDECPPWFVDKMETLGRGGMAQLSVAGEDPGMLAGVEPDRIRRSAASRGKALEAFYEMLMTNAFPWCVVSVPTPAWAGKVFPGLPEAQAVEALWEAVFAAVRVTGDGGAVGRWQAHVADIARRAEKLNGYAFRSLGYRNSLGTDLTVELPRGHVWLGGAEKSRAGRLFVANMPTEEIFTAPLRNGVNGTVVSSMPMSLDGNVIGSFTLTLAEGKIVGIRARDEREEALLRNAVSVDEGAAYLGEVALVPVDSPVARQGILFNNTLFDENASCHFAFGKAYPCLKDGDKLTKEELAARGVNDSVTHVDFMIGTEDLSVIGITEDGREIPVIVDGLFAL